MTQSRETVKWYEGAVVFPVFIYFLFKCVCVCVCVCVCLFRANVKKEHLGESNFCHCNGNFSKALLGKLDTWSQLCLKYFLEAVTQRCSASGLQFYEKRDFGTGVFLWILQNF